MALPQTPEQLDAAIKAFLGNNAKGWDQLMGDGLFRSCMAYGGAKTWEREEQAFCWEHRRPHTDDMVQMVDDLRMNEPKPAFEQITIGRLEIL